MTRSKNKTSLLKSSSSFLILLLRLSSRIRTDTKPCNSVTAKFSLDGAFVASVFVVASLVSCMAVRIIADPIVRIDIWILEDMCGKQCCITWCATVVIDWPPTSSLQFPVFVALRIGIVNIALNAPTKRWKNCFWRRWSKCFNKV